MFFAVASQGFWKENGSPAVHSACGYRRRKQLNARDIYQFTDEKNGYFLRRKNWNLTVRETHFLARIDSDVKHYILKLTQRPKFPTSVNC